MTREESRKIEQLYLDTFSRLYGVALAALREPSLAEEAVQDTFRIACSKPTALLRSQNPQGWLMNTLKNVLMKIRSQREYDRAYILPLLSEHEAVLGKNDEYETDILELLDKDDRRVLELTVLEGRTMMETAKIMGISLEACKKRAQRARKKLKEKYVSYEKGEK